MCHTERLLLAHARNHTSSPGSTQSLTCSALRVSNIDFAYVPMLQGTYPSCPDEVVPEGSFADATPSIVHVSGTSSDHCCGNAVELGAACGVNFPCCRFPELQASLYLACRDFNLQFLQGVNYFTVIGSTQVPDCSI